MWADDKLDIKPVHNCKAQILSKKIRVNNSMILTPVEWKFTIRRVKSLPVHSIFTPKEVITDVTTQGVKIEWIEWYFLESNL